MPGFAKSSCGAAGRFFDFFNMMLDAASSLVMISPVGLLGSRATEVQVEKKAAMVSHDERRSCWPKAIRTMCVAVAALVVWFASGNDTSAGLIVPSLGDGATGASEDLKPHGRLRFDRECWPYARNRQGVKSGTACGDFAGGMGGASSQVGSAAGWAALDTSACNARIDLQHSGHVREWNAGKPVQNTSDLLRPPRRSVL